MPRLWDLTTESGKDRLRMIMTRDFGQFDWNPDRKAAVERQQSGVKVEGRLESADEIARIMRRPPASKNDLRDE